MVQISTADINKQLGLDSTGDATKLLDAEETRRYNISWCNHYGFRGRYR
jgi:hypothetical protein